MDPASFRSTDPPRPTEVRTLWRDGHNCHAAPDPPPPNPSRPPVRLRRSKTQTVQHVTEYAVLPAELEQLPDLTGYLKLASQPNGWSVRLPTPP